MPIVGLPGNAPCVDQKTRGVAPTLVYGVPAVERQKAIVAHYGEHPTIRWQMVDQHGRPVDLRACLTAGDGGSSADAEDGPRLVLKLREMVGSDNCVATFAADATDAENGWVEAPLVDPSGISGPGAYIAEMAVMHDGEDPGVAIFSNVFTLYLEPSLFRQVSGRPGPPTIMEIRLALRDSSPAEARLLDAVTFDDAEIALAVVRPVQYFNEINPPLDTTFDSTNFPSRYHWCLGATAQLFFMLAEYYRKNQLAYGAGGISVDDFNKAPLYEQAGALRWADYKAWSQQVRIRMNLAACWGSADSPYAYSYGYGGWNTY